jgi:hypothetical protein
MADKLADKSIGNFLEWIIKYKGKMADKVADKSIGNFLEYVAKENINYLILLSLYFCSLEKTLPTTRFRIFRRNMCDTSPHTCRAMF